MKRIFILLALAVSAIFTACHKETNAIKRHQNVLVLSQDNGTKTVLDSIQIDAISLKLTPGINSITLPENLSENSTLHIYTKLEAGETIRVTDANGQVFEQYISAELLQVLHAMVGQTGDIDPQTGNIETPDFEVGEVEIEFDNAAIGYGYNPPKIEIIGK
jgi:hypothetical protein